MKFIVYNRNGKILRTGICAAQDLFLQAGDSEFVMEGAANDITQKIANAGIKGKVVNKTTEEIELDSPVVLAGEQPANITNEQWQDVLKRLDKLEKS